MDSVVWIILAAILGVAESSLTAALGLLAVAALAAGGWRSGGILAQCVTFAVVAVAGLVDPAAGQAAAAAAVRAAAPVRGGGAGRAAGAGGAGGHRRRRAGADRREEWSARAYDETLVIPAGTTVDVIEIEGATALVYPRE